MPRNKSTGFFIASDILKKFCESKEGHETVRALRHHIKRLRNLVQDLEKKVEFNKRWMQQTVWYISFCVSFYLPSHNCLWPPMPWSLVQWSTERVYTCLCKERTRCSREGEQPTAASGGCHALSPPHLWCLTRRWCYFALRLFGPTRCSCNWKLMQDFPGARLVSSVAGLV